MFEKFTSESRTKLRKFYKAKTTVVLEACGLENPNPNDQATNEEMKQDYEIIEKEELSSPVKQFKFIPKLLDESAVITKEAFISVYTTCVIALTCRYSSLPKCHLCTGYTTGRCCTQ